MAIGFGPGSDMMKAYNSNRKQLKRSKNLNEVTNTHPAKSDRRQLKYKEISEDQLEEFRLKLKEQKRKDTLKLYIVSVAVVFGVVYLLFL